MYKEIIIALAASRTPDVIAKIVLRNPSDFKDFQLLKTASVEILKAAAEHAGDYRLAQFLSRAEKRFQFEFRSFSELEYWFFKGLDELYPGYSKHLSEAIKNQELHKGNH